MGNILVVDDNEDMCQIISDVLKAEGHMVGIACDGESALNELRTKTYDLMILDYKLFDMNGLEVLEKLQGTTPALCTIMISAYGSEPVRARAQELEVYDFFDKPFDVNVLVKTVKKALMQETKNQKPEGREQRADINLYSVSPEGDLTSEYLKRSGSPLPLKKAE